MHDKEDEVMTQLRQVNERLRRLEERDRGDGPLDWRDLSHRTMVEDLSNCPHSPTWSRSKERSGAVPVPYCQSTDEED